MSTLVHFIDTLLLRLVWTTAQATVLIGVLWLLARPMQRMSPAMRCMLWWLVAAQLLLGITISKPVELPWLPASTHAAATVTHERIEQTNSALGSDASTVQVTTGGYEPRAASETTPPAWSWTQGIVAIWLLGVLLQGVFAIRQWRESQILVRQSQPLRDATLQLLCAEQAHILGLRHIPHLRTSDAIVSPQVTGLWRPLVLLPAGQTLSSEELSMALGHELAHLRRGDLWLGWVPAIAHRLFFFHPLVSWAMREYAVYREAACDAQVLERNDTAPQSYGHLLLRLGVAHPVHAGLAGASSTFQSLKRRLLLLQQSANDTTPRAPGWLLVAAIAAIGIFPYRVTAMHAVMITDHDTAQTASDISVPVTPATPATPATPLTPPTPPTPPTPETPPTPVTPLTPATPATPPTPPIPPTPPTAADLGFHAHNIDIDTEPHASRGIALFDGDTVIINGSDSDVSDVKRLLKTNQPLLWFRRDGKSYVVHDQALIHRAKEAYAPIGAMAQAQGELAGKQGAVAGEEGGLAARQGALASREAELQGRRASLESQRIATQVDRSSEEAAGQLASLKGQLAGLDAEAAEITREHMEIDREAADLDKRSADLSRRQADMSKQQVSANREAEQRLDQLLDEAVAKGQAERINR
jgi:bla regulator protein blaR1